MTTGNTSACESLMLEEKIHGGAAKCTYAELSSLFILFSSLI